MMQIDGREIGTELRAVREYPLQATTEVMRRTAHDVRSYDPTDEMEIGPF